MLVIESSQTRRDEYCLINQMPVQKNVFRDEDGAGQTWFNPCALVHGNSRTSFFGTGSSKYQNHAMCDVEFTTHEPLPALQKHDDVSS